MRGEAEMFELILGAANADERIRAVLLSGSRVDPSRPKDSCQDYDITYFVHDVGPFWDNVGWVETQFGTPAVMQMPELNTHPLLAPENDGHFTYLMLFGDGNRIDLSIRSMPYIDRGEPAVVLLDKDGCMPEIKADPGFFHIGKPSADYFRDVCNEFWWCLNNVAKGIARDELPYAMESFHRHVRDMLDQVVQWKIGMDSNFSLSAGKMNRNFKTHLSPELYRQYVKTYCDGDYEHLWGAVLAACGLFHTLAEEIGERFGFRYDQKEEDGAMDYLCKIRAGLL